MTDNKNAELKITRMACVSCAKAVEKALNALGGINAANVDLAKKTAFVDYDAGRITLHDLRKAVQGTGFKATEARNV